MNLNLSDINPSAYGDQTEFPIGGGETVFLPTVAKGQAVTAAARKLERGVELYEGVTLKVPKAEAMAIATAVVDPSALRNDIDRKRVSMHRTPSGHTLVSVEVRVWAAGVSCDGANGRGRVEVNLRDGAVWPRPEDGSGEPVVQYRTTDIERLRKGVRDNAARIGSPDMRLRLREDAGGVWNPIYVVAGRGLIQPTIDDEVQDEISFVHTAEGSTRLVTCQEGLGLERDEPLAYAGDTLNLVRRVRAALAGRLVGTPDSDDVRHAIKVATLPAHIVIGALAPDHNPSETPFPTIVSDFVQSIHEEPRPWNAIAQGGVRGERLVLKLLEEDLITQDQAADVIGRDDYHVVTAAPDVIAGRLLRVVSHPDSWSTVRHAVLDDPSSQALSRKRFAQTVGPLLLNIYGMKDRPKTAVAALGSDFKPGSFRYKGWGVREHLTVRDLLSEALDDLDGSTDRPSDAATELAARSLGALAVLGLVLSDQGSSVNEVSWLRGSVARVVANLMTCAGGLKTLCEAAERLEDDSLLMPFIYTPEGEHVRDADGNPRHLDPQNKANIELRRLAFRNNRPADEDDSDEQLSAHDRFVVLQRETATAVAALAEKIDELLDARGDDNQRLVDSERLQRTLLESAPKTLNKLRDRILVNLEPEPESLTDLEDEEQDAFTLDDDEHEDDEPLAA